MKLMGKHTVTEFILRSETFFGQKDGTSSYSYWHIAKRRTSWHKVGAVGDLMS